MHILIIGAAGMIGAKLTQKLGQQPALAGKDITKMTLVDVVAPKVPQALEGLASADVADLSEPGTAERLVAQRPDMIFHLAAIVSGEAEADFDKGYRINLDGTRWLFEAVRQEGLKQPYAPRVIFASSIAVFGAPFPDKIGDEFLTAPLTSYGTQKAIGELLLSDYTRRGFFDGIGLRLPTICIRPGLPNKAASGFFSNILREPLAGKEAVLPVSEDVRHWFASPRAAVGFLIHAATMDLAKLGPPQRHASRAVGDRGRGDRQPQGGRRRQGRRSDPPRARSGHREDRVRLGARFPARPRPRTRLPRRNLVRRDHQGAYRR
jgi:D-erythronate 2-dehydrogenase